MAGGSSVTAGRSLAPTAPRPRGSCRLLPCETGLSSRWPSGASCPPSPRAARTRSTARGTCPTVPCSSRRRNTRLSTARNGKLQRLLRDAEWRRSRRGRRRVRRRRPSRSTARSTPTATVCGPHGIRQRPRPRDDRPMSAARRAATHAAAGGHPVRGPRRACPGAVLASDQREAQAGSLPRWGPSPSPPGSSSTGAWTPTSS